MTITPQTCLEMDAADPLARSRDAFVLPVGVEAHGVRGHAHYLAKEMKMTATLPDGTTKGLLWIEDWDFGWQDSYFYKAPFRLPQGTRIDVEIVYDNSADNVRNPHSPPQRVRWGRAANLCGRCLIEGRWPHGGRLALRQGRGSEADEDKRARALWAIGDETP